MLAGLAFAHVLEQPAKMLYDAPHYLALQRSLYAQSGPPHIGGFLEPAAIAATGLLAVFIRQDRRAPGFTLGAILALAPGFPMVFFWLVARANAVFLASAPNCIPIDWALHRSNWQTGHAIRFALQGLALALLILSLALDATHARDA